MRLRSVPRLVLAAAVLGGLLGCSTPAAPRISRDGRTDLARALSLCLSGDHHAALAAFERAHALSPTDARAWASHARCCEHVDDPIAAECCFREAWRLAPSDVAVELALVLRRQGRLEEARDVLEPELRREWLDPPACGVLAELELALGRREQAAAALRAALRALDARGERSPDAEWLEYLLEEAERPRQPQGPARFAIGTSPRTD